VGPVKIQFNGGYTYINPIDPEGDKSMDGNDDPRQLIPALSFFPTLPDRPYTLKYRSKHLVRGSYTVEYRKVSMTVNGRFNSKIINVDKLLLFDIIPAMAVNPGARSFREMSNHGFTVLDAMVGYEFGKKGRSYISAHVFNLTNQEYMTVPGLLGEQRSYAMQYKLAF
jgi:outer membrane receptor protein involved in Fe transport